MNVRGAAAWTLAAVILLAGLPSGLWAEDAPPTQFILVNRTPGARWNAGRPESFRREDFEEVRRALPEVPSARVRPGIGFIFSYFQVANEEAKRAGFLLGLVTGRPHDELLGICPEIGLFDLVVDENGSVLHFPGTGAVEDLRPLAAGALFGGTGAALYKKRTQTVEPVFGQIKDARGLDGFCRRGQSACGSEWAVICATHNLLKLFRSGKATRH
jgi:hypothetical protein